MPPASDSQRTLTRQTDDSLAEFFSRPIQVATYTWTPGTAFALQRFSPWLNFFTNPRVANRLTNYYLVNCTMKVKFQVSGNGFYWGRLMADWHPYFSSDLVTSSADTFYAAIGASQRMKVFLDPTNSQGGELHIPFVYSRNSMSAVEAEWEKLGQVIIRQLVTLRHANASTVPVTITAFAWADDVTVSIPTTVNAYGLTAQAGEADESDTVKVSSTVAAVANQLAVVPAIAPLAMATSMIATGVGQAARLFGFSRPANLTDPTPMRPRYVSSLATTDSGDVVDKLTVTSKQETTIDPRVIGVDTGDELVIADIAARESYMSNVSWSTNTANGSLLLNYRVVPFDSRTDGTYYYLPACAFACRPFRYWCGTVRYRFVIVASAFHKGRLRFVWDPAYIAGTGLPELNVGFSHIVDLEKEREFVFEIPWGQADPFKPIPQSIGSTDDYSNPTRYTTIDPYSNGTLGVFVQNTLTSVNDTLSTISILLFKSCTDLCVAQPNEGAIAEIVNAYSYTVQSEEQNVPDGMEPTNTSPGEMMAAGQCDEGQMKIFFGEVITSFRQLLKRYNYHSSYRDATSSALAVWSVIATDFPAYKGYSSTALHRTTAAKKINYVQSTLLHYLAPAFLACRGGLRSKYTLTSTGGAPAMNGFTITRRFNIGDVGESLTPLTLTTPSTYARENILSRGSMYNGGTLTAPEMQPVLEVEHPYYKAARFDLTKDINLSYDSTALGGQGLGHCTHKVNSVVSGAGTRQLTRYIAVAEDFNLVFFQGCPPIAAFPDATMPAAAIA